MEHSLLERAELLLQQQRYEEATSILTQLLEQSPTNPDVLALLSQVMLETGNKERADELINNAIELAPDEDYLFYIKARVMLELEKWDLAEENLNTVVTLNPYNPHAFALWGSIRLARKDFEQALEYANKSLELDSENILGLNIRSTALQKLGRKEEAFQTIEGALNEDPNNAFTHSNYGWNLLEKGDHKAALEHFKLALQNDPNLYHAQAGMLNALKAKYWFYRMFLKYSFWMSNMTAKYQWGVIIGFYVVFRVLKSLAVNNEALQPFLVPILVGLGIVAFSTWVINPLSNLFLRLNPYGKHLLDKEEKMSSNFVGISALIFVGGLIAFALLGDMKWLTITVYGFAMMVPLGTMLQPAKYKGILPIYTIFMALVGALAVYFTFMEGELFNGFTMVFSIAFFLFQWVANFMLIRENNI